MDERNARLKINLTTREFEVEGTENFVREYAVKFEDMLSSLAKTPVKANAVEPGNAAKEDRQTPPAELPETFGEYLHMFPSNIKDLDKMLIAGYYVQLNNPENVFSTGTASALLKEQGIRLSNPANCVTHNREAKRVITVSRGKFRVSRPTGVDYIQSLLSQSAG